MNIETQFKQAALVDGIAFDGPIVADGALHRCHIANHKTGTKNGAYILHANGNPAGWGMDYKTGISFKWTASGNREPLADVMRRQIETDRAKREIEQAERQKDAADKARFIWRAAKPIDNPDMHPYLVRKHIKPYLARLSRGALVIPILNESRELVNLQFIDASGNKRFLSGGKKKGCFSVIGDSSKENKLLICEGYATGASLHQALGLFVMVAMDAGNLEPVSLAARRMFPDYEIIIMGDNDLNGVGQAAACNAALAVGGKYKIPETPGHDWNDSLSIGVA